ncbi:hypothetical protein [Streptomyces sp. ODS28]|uniref:hypothetical protein n=1 Tax=Streptomyces sp. ODS28 TaxID=3136688 RepID=UPI0031F0FB39
MPQPMENPAARALDVLDRIPPARVRSTSRQRLANLDTELASFSSTGGVELRERVRALPAAVDPHGSATA